ncbi:MAG: hypothetical protein AB8G11_25020 [Saprospiraceae bacterium]
MLNQSGAKWTTKRKPKKFGEKRNLSVGDEKNRDSWAFSLNRHSSETYLSKKERLKQKRSKRWLFVIVGIPTLIVCFFACFKLYKSFINKGIHQEKTFKSINEDINDEDANVFGYRFKKGQIALTNGDYEEAIIQFEKSIEQDIPTKWLYENLILACEQSCTLSNKNCDKIKKYQLLKEKL